MNPTQTECYEILESISDPEFVTTLFLNWLGTQVLDEGFLEYLKEEMGY